MKTRLAKKVGTRILKDTKKRARLEMGAKVTRSSITLYKNGPSVHVTCIDKNGDTWGWFPGHPAYDHARYDRFGRRVK